MKRSLWCHIFKFKINYVDMQQKYVNMRDIAVIMLACKSSYIICLNMGQFRYQRQNLTTAGGHSYSNMMHVSIFKSHADINTSHVDINILHVYIIMLHPAFGLLSETSSRSEFSILQNFSCMLTQLSCKWGAETCPQNFCQSWFILSPPPQFCFINVVIV